LFTLKDKGDGTMTAIELRQKLIDQINRLSFQKLLFLEKLIQSLENYFPDTSGSDLGGSSLESPVVKVVSPEDDPIIGMCSGIIPNLSERAEEILESGIKPRSGWTWKE
jgi:hypothetical protein